MPPPEAERRARYREGHGLDLAGAAPAGAARLAHREARHDGADVAQVVAVIEVVDRLGAGEQGGILERFQAQQLGVEGVRSEEQTAELQLIMRDTYAVLCFKQTYITIIKTT